jgi:hypothetical protein
MRASELRLLLLSRGVDPARALDLALLAAVSLALADAAMVKLGGKAWLPAAA